VAQAATLDSRTFMAAKLRRTGGRLSYNDELIPTGAEVILAHAANGAASLVYNGKLIPVKLADVTDETFEFVEEVTEDDATHAMLASSRDQVIPGVIIIVIPGMVLRRTGRPFSSLHEHYAPYDEELTVASHHNKNVFYETSDFQHRSFPAQYLTIAYFEVISR
jgi:hypothetical protein